jgi:hypothetical protein
MSFIDRVPVLGARKRMRASASNAAKSSVTAVAGSTSPNTDLVLTPPTVGNTYLKSAGMYCDPDTDDGLKKLRDKIREYSVYNDTLSIVINLCSMFIAKGPRIDCESEKNKAVLESVFDLNELESFLQDFGKEYLISGEATSIAVWLDDEETFTKEDIQNPDDIEIVHGSVMSPDAMHLKMSEDIAKSIDLYASTSDSKYLQESGVKTDSEFDEDIDDETDAIIKELSAKIDKSTNSIVFEDGDDTVIRMVNKKSSWDDRGISVFASALSALAQNESLDAALFEQLNMLITPTIVGIVGLKAGELGPNSPAWIPTQQEMNTVGEAYKQMLMGTRRIGVFSVGVDWHNAFGDSKIQSLDADYARCEGKILRCVSAGKGLLDGSSGGPWSSNALNRDVFSSYLQSIQVKLSKAFQPRIDKVIHELGICKTDIDVNGKETPHLTKNGKKIYEEAHLSFDDGIMKDANQVLQTALTLKSNGVPISTETLASLADIGINVNSEMSKLKQESDRVDDSGIEDIVDIGNSDESSIDDDEPKSPLNKDAQ